MIDKTESEMKALCREELAKLRKNDVQRASEMQRKYDDIKERPGITKSYLYANMYHSLRRINREYKS